MMVALPSRAAPTPSAAPVPALAPCDGATSEGATSEGVAAPSPPLPHPAPSAPVATTGGIDLHEEVTGALALEAPWRSGTATGSPGTPLGLWRSSPEPEEASPATASSASALATPPPTPAEASQAAQAAQAMVLARGAPALSLVPAVPLVVSSGAGTPPAPPEVALVLARPTTMAPPASPAPPAAERRTPVSDTIYDNRDTVPALRKAIDRMFELLARAENIYIGYLSGLSDPSDVLLAEQFRSLGKDALAQLLPNGRSTQECATTFLAVEQAKQSSKKARKEGHTMEDLLHAADGVPNAFYAQVIEQGEDDAAIDERQSGSARPVAHLPSKTQVEQAMRSLRATYAWTHFPEAYLRNLYCKGYLRGIGEKRALAKSAFRGTFTDVYVPFATLSTTFMLSQRLLLDMATLPRIGQEESFYLLARYGKLVHLHMPIFIAAREDHNLPKIFDTTTCRLLRQGHADLESLPLLRR